jgi:hypothetical protein
LQTNKSTPCLDERVELVRDKNKYYLFSVGCSFDKRNCRAHDENTATLSPVNEVKQLTILKFIWSIFEIKETSKVHIHGYKLNTILNTEKKTE